MVRKPPGLFSPLASLVEIGQHTALVSAAVPTTVISPTHTAMLML
jgi:hypothetical protein